MTTHLPSRSLAAEWFWLARPFSLTAAAAPVLIGSALALVDGVFAVGPFLAMLIACLLIQAATNMFNEYYDAQRGLDTADAVGIAGTIVHGRMAARTVLTGAVLAYAAALVPSLYLVVIAGWPILLLGAISVLAGYFYTGGPRPIAYTPLSEATVFVFMGVLIIVLAYAVQAGTYPLHVVLAALPESCLVSAILLANNIRDLEPDTVGRRRTLPIVLGRAGGIGVYRGLLAAAYVIAAALVALGIIGWPIEIVLLSLPLARRLWRGIAATTVRAQLDPIVKGTAGLHAVFGLLFAAGVLLSALLR